MELRPFSPLFGILLAATVILPLARFAGAQSSTGRQPAESLESPAGQAGREAPAEPEPGDEAELQTGIALTRRGQFAAAIPHFLAARGRARSQYALNFNLALCYVGTREFEAAIQILTRLRESDHSTPDVDNLLAQAYIGNGQSQEGFQAFQRAVARNPQNESLYLFVADACMDRQNYELGLKVVDTGLERLPGSPRLHYEGAVFLSQSGASDRARKEFSRAVQLAPEGDVAYMATAQKALLEGKISDAVRAAREGVKRGYDNYILLTILGEALLRSGAAAGQPDLGEAQDALEKSLKMRPNYPSAELALGKVYLLDNRLPDAIRHLEKARALDPENGAVYANLATAYRRSGDVQQAQAMLAALARINAEQAEKIASTPGDRKANYAQGVQ